MPNEYNTLSRNNHLAVPIEHCIIVFGGTWGFKQPYGICTIWVYNWYTEAWKKHSASIEEITKQLGNDAEYLSLASHSACAAAIGADIFLFGRMEHRGGVRFSINPLMKLSRNNQGEFSWSCIKYQSKIRSSRYAYQTGWGYAEKLWIFGGGGVEVDDYLNYNGGFDLTRSYYNYNNQLLCFDPSCEKCTNPQCSGNIPEPRSLHSTAILKRHGLADWGIQRYELS